jgi:hypothetical protein
VRGGLQKACQVAGDEKTSFFGEDELFLHMDRMVVVKHF